MKKLMMTSLVALGFSLLASNPAAAMSVSGNLLPKDNDLSDPFPPAATGTYHVDIQLVSTVGSQQTWQIQVKGNNDGNTAPGSPQAGTDIKHPARVIQVLTRDANGNILGVALNPNGNTVNVLPNSPHNSPGFDTVPANWEGEAKGSAGNESATWTAEEAPGDIAESDDFNVQLNPYGQNVFTAQWTVNLEGSDGARFFTIDATDGNQQWSRTLSVVPEPASLALAAAGLGPVAGLLKRRRRNTEVEETEEVA